TRLAEIARRNDERARPHPGSVVPVVHGGQRLARERGVCRGFEPAHAGHREFVLTFGMVAGHPGRRSRTSRAIAKTRDRLFEGERPASVGERFLPQLAPFVAALVDELLELAIRHLVPIDEVVGHFDPRKAIVSGYQEGHGSAWH